MVSIDARILRALRGAGQGSMPGGDLAQQLGISRAALWRHVEELRALGYDIQASPHLGYRLVRAADVLHADDLLARLGPTKVVGRDIRVFHETTSTNDVVERLARDGVKEGVVVFAEAQTRGRGRMGRKWVSPGGKGLWFSVLLRPKLAGESRSLLTIASATALARAIRKYTELRPEIKWPNDVLIGGRKIAGILAELSAELHLVRHVVLGIGVNVNLDGSDFPLELRPHATALSLECGHQLDRGALAAGVLRELDYDYDRLIRGEFEALADEWEAQCTTLGREVTIRAGTRSWRGRAESLDATGALLLRTHHGHLERISGGDVMLEE
jgi:BirA family biotin operon repressor/biotin-[acetyl-CoA-carboxylase] ligase